MFSMRASIIFVLIDNKFFMSYYFCMLINLNLYKLYVR